MASLLLLLAWRFSLSILSSVLVKIVYMCKKISINVCSQVPFSKNPHYTKTSQMICLTNQLAGFYTVRVHTEKYFQTDFGLLTLTCIKWVPGDPSLIFLATIFTQKNAKKLRFHVFPHFNSRKHLILSFHLKQTKFTKNCEFVPIEQNSKFPVNSVCFM